MFESVIGLSVGFLLGAVPTFILLKLVVNESQRKDATISDLHDRLAARSLPEYKAYMPSEPQPEMPQGRYVSDPTGMIVGIVPSEDVD